MIIIDSRTGSKELLYLFPPGMAQLDQLDFGDVCFIGRGENDQLISIGIERKCIMDLINSMTTGRLSGHQVPGLLKTYDFNYLVIEGVWRQNDEGILEQWRGKWKEMALGTRRFMGKEVTSYLNTLTVKLGALTHGKFVLWQTSNKLATVQYILNLYHWWTSKNYDAHRSHLMDYTPVVDFCKPPLLYRWAKELDGVGGTRAKAVSKHFDSVLSMVLADSKEWQKIEGIGKKLADSIVKQLSEVKP